MFLSLLERGDVHGHAAASPEFRRGRAAKTVLVGAVVGEGLEQHGRAVQLVEHDRDGLRLLRLEVGRHDRLGCDQRPALVGLEGDLEGDGTGLVRRRVHVRYVVRDLSKRDVDGFDHAAVVHGSHVERAAHGSFSFG